MRIGLVLQALLLLLVGCSPYQPVPPDVRMPVAVIRDTGVVESSSRAQIFAVTRIDGRSVFNAFDASRQASRGTGFDLTARFPWREVPIRLMRIQLTASHETGAPIHAIASQLAGNFLSVQGVVEFLPEEGREYVVNGRLDKDAASVWLEDAETGLVVSEVISERGSNGDSGGGWRAACRCTAMCPCRASVSSRPWGLPEKTAACVSAEDFGLVRAPSLADALASPETHRFIMLMRHVRRPVFMIHESAHVLGSPEGMKQDSLLARGE